ncbi:MAG: RNA polymerase sigma-70 factor [Bacteroidota bacterium]
MKQLPEHIIQAIKNGDKEAFEQVFKQYYNALFNLSKGILKDEAIAEEQVQEVFIKLWERKEELQADIKLFPYLLTSVRNRSYNYVRDHTVAQKYVDHQLQQYREQIFNQDYEQYSDEIILKLNKVIDQLPDKCREVFKLSRFENLSHKEISKRLNISTKTIENHITKAMKVIRAQMTQLLIFITFWLGDF